MHKGMCISQQANKQLHQNLKNGVGRLKENHRGNDKVLLRIAVSLILLMD
jgi:hypothetical protein